MATALTLLIPDKPDVERDAVAVAWERAFGPVLRVGRFWDPPAVEPGRVRVYGGDAFCLVLAEKLGLALHAPPDAVLATAPASLLHRRVRAATLGSLRAPDFPRFVKPVVPKQFRGAVYPSPDALAEETCGLGADTEVLCSDVVNFVAEARAFVLDGAVRTCAVYEGEADRAQAVEFAGIATASLPLPRGCVVDVGRLADGRWAVVECNAAWGAGLNGCDASAALACIEAASG